MRVTGENRGAHESRTTTPGDKGVGEPLLLTTADALLHVLRERLQPRFLE